MCISLLAKTGDVLLCACVCVVRGLHLCMSSNVECRTLKVSCRHTLIKGRGMRACPCVCVLMRDWHDAREASLVKECGSRQIDCGYSHSIRLSTNNPPLFSFIRSYLSIPLHFPFVLRYSEGFAFVLRFLEIKNASIYILYWFTFPLICFRIRETSF